MKTVRSFLKAAIKIRDQPVSFLNGYDKLTEREQYLISSMTADIANEMGEDEFKAILKKFNLLSKSKPQTS